MKKLLIVVDVQNDFVDQALGTKEAVMMIPDLLKVIEDPSYDYVMATMDTHDDTYLNTNEGKHLPVVHCVKDTNGWQLYPSVKEALKERHAEIIEKPSFGSEELAAKVKEYHPDEIVLTGLCTDICVISNALLIKAALPEADVKVIAKATAATTPAAQEASLAVMRSCQIEVV